MPAAAAAPGRGTATRSTGGEEGQRLARPTAAPRRLVTAQECPAVRIIPPLAVPPPGLRASQSAVAGWKYPFPVGWPSANLQ